VTAIQFLQTNFSLFLVFIRPTCKTTICRSRLGQHVKFKMCKDLLATLGTHVCFELCFVTVIQKNKKSIKTYS